MNYTTMEWYSFFALFVGAGLALLTEHVLIPKVKDAIRKFLGN